MDETPTWLEHLETHYELREKIKAEQPSLEELHEPNKIIWPPRYNVRPVEIDGITYSVTPDEEETLRKEIEAKGSHEGYWDWERSINATKE